MDLPYLAKTYIQFGGCLIFSDTLYNIGSSFIFKMANNVLFFKFLIVTGILFYVKRKVVGTEDDISKRILMQSNDDLVTEITNLKTLVKTLEAKITGT